MKCFHPQYKYIYITLHTDKCAFDSSEKVLLQTEKFWHCSLILVKSNANWHVLGFHCWSKVTSVPKWPVYGRARPSRRAFGENSPSKARIFVILPVYM